MINESQLLQEKPKPRHNKAESHQRQPSANPGEESPLCSQIVTESSPLPSYR
jgi:hypothetical protein